MTRDDIIRMAQEAGLLEVIDDAYQERNDWQPFVERFAALVAAHEREVCAVTAWSTGMDLHMKKQFMVAREIGAACAAAIRARDQQ